MSKKDEYDDQDDDYEIIIDHSEEDDIKNKLCNFIMNTDIAKRLLENQEKNMILNMEIHYGKKLEIKEATLSAKK